MSLRTVSFSSSNHERQGTAFSGWNMYDAGELSTMMQSPISLPRRAKSWEEGEYEKREKEGCD